MKVQKDYMKCCDTKYLRFCSVYQCYLFHDFCSVLKSCNFVLFTGFPDKRQVRTKKEYWFHSGLDRKVTENVKKKCTLNNTGRYNQFETEIP